MSNLPPLMTHPSLQRARALTVAALMVSCSGNGGIASSASGGSANAQGGVDTSAGGQASDGEGGLSTTSVGVTGGALNTAIGGASSVTVSTGGAHSGGTTTVGGSSGSGLRTGGATSTMGGSLGSTVRTGGATSTLGGSSSSGVRSGGATSTGGSSQGGLATGGNATGGARSSSSSPTSTTGGSTSTGVANTGGAPGTSTSTGTPSSGCTATAPTIGAAIDGTLTVGGQERTYRLSVPSDYKAGEALPLVFVFNGVGGTGAQAQQFFQLESGHRAIFIYPDALPNSTTSGSIAWVFDQTGIDVAYFDALVAFLKQTYCIDTSRIFALGASSGAIMSNMLGCFRGDVLRAIAPSSGMTWQQSGCKGDVAVMVICGAKDTYNACDDAKNGGLSQTNVWVPQNACTTQTVPSPIAPICNAFQGCKAADPVLLCTHAGGHGWPTTDGDFWWQFFMSLN